MGLNENPESAEAETAPNVSFLRRRATPAEGSNEPAPDTAAPADDPFENPTPPRRANGDATREAERELERKASGHAADELIGANDKPIVVGDIAEVTFGEGKKKHQKNGTVLAIEGGGVRVRLVGQKEVMGDVYPAARVASWPHNSGKPVKSKAEQKKAAEHVTRVREYEVARSGGAKSRPADGFAHAHRAADDETAPLPKRLLKGGNSRISDATIYRHLGSIRHKLAKLATANSEVREAWKRAQDDGVDKRMLKRIMDELKLSPEEIVAEHNLLQDYRGAVSLPTAVRIEDEPAEDKDAIERRKAYARKAGEQGGYRGADMSTNPYPDPTDPCRLEWNEGWRKAQNDLSAGFKVLK
jgi:hypothetical protein